jgi:hypothetical protein
MSSIIRDRSFSKVPTAAILVASAGWPIASIVTLSEPRPGCIMTGLDLLPSYPLLAVATSSLSVAIEAFVLWLILCAKGTLSPTRRMLRALAATTPPAVFGLLFLMHSAPYYTAPVRWLCVISAFLSLMLLMEGGTQVVAHFLARSYRSD